MYYCDRNLAQRYRDCARRAIIASEASIAVGRSQQDCIGRVVNRTVRALTGWACSKLQTYLGVLQERV